ncbi:hypothetical protein AB0395_22175 [Streptosporangium sp. NPDC051023]|uniref:hypothetical protein n=1 Tax=Streptosporangium sp. NPDC051023 TaxID=3155410 RepID=UPI00344BE292
MSSEWNVSVDLMKANGAWWATPEVEGLEEEARGEGWTVTHTPLSSHVRLHGPVPATQADTEQGAALLGGEIVTRLIEAAGITHPIRITGKGSKP